MRMQARYVACIGETLYIDGGNPDLSGPARWMNHAPAEEANVCYKKQRFGPSKGMHFYAKRDVAAGEEASQAFCCFCFRRPGLVCTAAHGLRPF